MNILGSTLFSPPVILTAAVVWHVGVLWLLWRIARALERRSL